VVAAVVDEARGGVVGEFLHADEILQTQGGGVHVQFGGEHVDQALNAVGGFGAAGAAIGIGRDAIGEDAGDVGRDALEFVDARHHEHGKGGDGVSDFSPERQSATTPRVSMAVGMRRWLVMRCLMTTSAFSKASATSPPSWWKV
jgi:hypothetical protein